MKLCDLPPEKRERLREIQKKHNKKRGPLRKSWRSFRKTNRQCHGLHKGQRCTRWLPKGYYKRCPRCVALENPVYEDKPIHLTKKEVEVIQLCCQEL